MDMRELIPWSRSRSSLRRREDEPFSMLRREMNQLFDEFFNHAEMPLMERAGEFQPAVNVTETEKEIKVTAELPGIDPEDIDLKVERDILVIQGEKKEETEDRGENYYRMERSYGSFYRSIRIPGEVVDQDKIEADFKNGVLKVTLPKRPDAQTTTRRIPVKTR